MIWRSGLMLAAVALSAFALPASAALYAEVGIAPPAASVEVVPDQTYTYSYSYEPYSYSYEPSYVERHSYIVETPQYYSEPRVYVQPFDDD